MTGARHIASVLLLTLAVTPAPSPVRAQPVQGPEAVTITIRLSNFAFTPDRLSLRVGVPARLHLVNESGGGHNFSAPGLFSASTVESGSVPPNGTVEIPAGGSADVTLVPRTLGAYPVRCTHFLHSFFGMTGTIYVVG